MKNILLIVLCLGFAMTQYNYQVLPYNQSYTEVSYEKDIKILDFYQWNGKKMVIKQTLRLFEDGSIASVVNLNAEGEKDGKYAEYYENGQISEGGNYIDGEKDGEWTYYDENGQIKYEGNYKDGERNGKRTWYYDNG